MALDPRNSLRALPPNPGVVCCIKVSEMQGSPVAGTIENCYNCKAPLHVAHSTKRDMLHLPQSIVYCCSDCSLGYDKIKPFRAIKLPSAAQFQEMVEHVRSGKYDANFN